MKKSLTILLILIGVLFLFNYSSAAEIDDLLLKAKKEGKAVMLEIGSVGCIPCDRMKPIMQKLSTNYKSKLEVIFIDIRKESATARKFDVYVIPTQVFLDRNGKEFHRHVGYYPYEEIVRILKKAGL